MKQCLDNNIDLINMFYICNKKYILENVWYNTFNPFSYSIISIDVKLPTFPVLTNERTHTFWRI